MARIRPENNFKTTLAESISATDTEATLTTPPTQTSGYVTFESNTDNFEVAKYTGVSGNKITGLVRGLDPAHPDDPTSYSTFAKSHAAGRRVEIANAAQYFEELAAKDDDNVFTGKNVFPDAGSANEAEVGTSYGVPSSPLAIPPKRYVDDQISAVVAGAVTAFAVQQDGADPSLNITIGAGYFMDGNTPINFSGVSGLAMTPSTTNYVMLSGSGVVIVNTTGFVEGFLPLATVTTDATDITSITDARSWLTLSSDDQVITRKYTYGDTISVGDVLRLDTADGKWKKADATVAANADDTFGIALDAGVDTDTDKRVQIGGIVTTVNGLSVAGTQYLSDTPGQVSNTQGTYKKIVGFSPDGSSMIFLQTQKFDDLGGVVVTASELNQLSGISSSVDSFNLNTLTSGASSDADALHTHPSLKEIVFARSYNFSVTTPSTETAGLSGTVPANKLEDKHGIKLSLLIQLQHFGASSSTYYVRLKFGGVTFYTFTDSFSGSTSRNLKIDAYIFNQSVVSQECSVYSEYFSLDPEMSFSTISVDTALNQVVEVTGEASGSSGTFAIKFQNCVAEYLYVE